jgi:hypothetical protein
MSVIDTTKNLEALSFTLTAEFDAGVERVWQLWEDPRQLERWWGPPTWPATFERFDFEPGGRASYYMTGPEGEKPRGWWLFTGMNGTEGTRTSTPANNQTDTNKRTNPATTPGTTKPQ